MPLLECPHCTGGLDSSLVHPSVRQKAAGFAREGSRMLAMQTLRDDAGMRITDAKWVTLHLVAVDGQCQKCRGTISTEESTFCSKCGALNISWLAGS